MRCFFMRGGHIVDVELIPGLTDEQAIEKCHALFKERKDRLDGFEIWDQKRVVVQHPAPEAEPSAEIISIFSRKPA
jgi:hypothetical protein